MIRMFSLWMIYSDCFLEAGDFVVVVLLLCCSMFECVCVCVFEYLARNCVEYRILFVYFWMALRSGCWFVMGVVFSSSFFSTGGTISEHALYVFTTGECRGSTRNERFQRTRCRRLPNSCCRWVAEVWRFGAPLSGRG